MISVISEMPAKTPTDVIKAYLNTLLMIDPKFMIITMYGKGIITSAEKLTIVGSNLSSFEQSDRLMDHLVRKLENLQNANDQQTFEHIFEVLLVCLTNDKHDRLVAEMRSFREHGSETRLSKNLTEIRGQLGDVESKVLDYFVDNDSKDETDAINFHFIDSHHLNLHHHYAIKPSPQTSKLGYVLIIDIQDYSGILGVHRSARDSELLKSTFEQIEHEVHVETNLTAKLFTSSIDGHLKACEQSKYSNFILFVLAFGNESEVVYAIDGLPVSLSAIRRKIQEFPYLYGSPKLFFFLSARGLRPERKVRMGEPALRDNGELFHISESAPNLLSEQNATLFKETGASGDCGKDSVDGSGSLERSESNSPAYRGTTSKNRKDTVPISADSFVCYACQKHHTVFGVKDQGSWFTNIFCGLLLERAKHLHVMDLITETTFYVSSMSLSGGSDNQEDKYGQLPEAISTLRKRFYFVHPN